MFEIGGAGQRVFNSAARTFFRTVFRTTARVRMIHLAPVPRSGPLILACNHISHFDPPFVGSQFPRHVDWMAMDELFRGRRFARALELTGAFRVNRNGRDRTALRTAVRRLHAGRVVGIFPEGGIRAGETSVLERAPMRPGIGMLALLSQSPLIPAVVVGTDRLYLKANWSPFHRPPIWFITGSPIPPPATDIDREAARAQVHDSLRDAFVGLKDTLLRDHGVSPMDLPHTPQARKGEDPFA